MPKFRIEATRTVPVFVIVEADNLEEAVEMANDLVAGDFDFIDGSEDEIEVVKEEVGE